jgi:hypothetical protein
MKSRIIIITTMAMKVFPLMPLHLRLGHRADVSGLQAIAVFQISYP